MDDPPSKLEPVPEPQQGGGAKSFTEAPRLVGGSSPRLAVIGVAAFRAGTRAEPCMSEQRICEADGGALGAGGPRLTDRIPGLRS